MRSKQNKRGFTLVELMVVAVIVAILAAVAIPLMTANKKRAMATEAEAGLGVVRTALRAMYAESGSYALNATGGTVAAIADITGLNMGDLDGRWFDHASYSLPTHTVSNYSIVANGSASTAPKAAEVSSITITLGTDGTFGRTGL
jgi:type IV pilus assembly protein PilA